MNRRKFLIGAGSLAAGSAAAMGTGAFTSVQAERTVSVSVADDSNALLALSSTSGPNGTYAETTGDNQVKVDISNASGSGVNDDSKTKILDIFSVQNQGTQPAAVYVPPGSVSPTAVGAPNGNYDGFYVDPQFTDQPNGSYSGPFSGTVVYFLSGGESNFTDAANRAFDDSGGINNYILDSGDSLNFGLQIEDDKNGVESDFNGDVSFDLKADAEVVPDSYTP
ncbi:hypothetical protein [Haloarcula laminariae]|uniref:hypothetical protein n=1 Tax=Haloarcula laminariae TaxID=2961577 RepID=UPI002404DD50|nr:hypothetical protein [Halomicroarcula sp. FL173]